MAERIVTLVQPRLLFPTQIKESRKQRVAAYARVSTCSEEQLGSVQAQKDYFEKLIQQQPDWEFVGIYADEGISGNALLTENIRYPTGNSSDIKRDQTVRQSL